VVFFFELIHLYEIKMKLKQGGGQLNIAIGPFPLFISWVKTFHLQIYFMSAFEIHHTKLAIGVFFWGNYCI